MLLVARSGSRLGYSLVVMRPIFLGLVVFAAACGSDASDTSDASSSSVVDAAAAAVDGANAAVDATPSAPDAQPSEPDAGARMTLLPAFCPGSVTAPGFYEGTLGANLNDISGCDGQLSAPGRDGSVRLELAPGATVSATMRHDGDGILYILDRCPVTSSCLDTSDSSISGAESVSYTNNTGETNTVYVVLDSDDSMGPQTFELDLAVAN